MLRELNVVEQRYRLLFLRFLTALRLLRLPSGSG
jgi:hypothetical protein